MPSSAASPLGANGQYRREASRPQPRQQPATSKGCRRKTKQEEEEKQHLFQIEQEERRRVREVLRKEKQHGTLPRMKSVPESLCERVALSMIDSLKRELIRLPGRLSAGAMQQSYPLFLNVPYLEDICRLRPLKPSCFRRGPAMGRREREKIEAVQRERDKLHSKAAENFAQAELPTTATFHTLRRTLLPVPALGHGRPVSAPPGRTQVPAQARPHSAGADREDISAQPRGGAGPRWRPQTAGALGGRGRLGTEAKPARVRSARPLGRKEHARPMSPDDWVRILREPFALTAGTCEERGREDLAWARGPVLATNLRVRSPHSRFLSHILRAPPNPSTLNPEPSTTIPKFCTLNPEPKPQVLNPVPGTLTPDP